MCRRCVDEYGGFDVDITPEMHTVANMITLFYRLPQCSTGGPLHIVVDDFNIDDACIDFCEKSLAESYGHWAWSKSAEALGRRIIDGLRPLTLAQRAAVLWAADK